MEHKYLWQGSKLVSEYYGGKELEFFYDESGNPYAFSYKASSTATPVMYYYLTNLQGDVTGILNASGNSVASYTYNAWGKLLSSSGTMASINPLRYRGYYYDAELEMYYLKSRYYDPEICRFINADIYASTGQGFIGCNMFVYCGNNPVNHVDPFGTLFKELLDAFSEALKQASGIFAFAGAVTQADSIMPGPADLLGGAIAGLALLTCFGAALYDLVSANSFTISLPEIDEKTAVKTGTRRYNYWQADLVQGQVIISTPLTLAEACMRVASGGSIMCRNQAAAATVLWLNGYHNNVGPEIHGECGFYPHYHPTRNHKGYKSIHIWFFE